MIPSPARCVSLLAAALIAAPALADEGMWTFDNPPSQQLKQKHGFEPTKEWLDHVRLASVRFMDGGSGSFVSPDGLMITNHHVGLGCIQNVSSAEQRLRQERLLRGDARQGGRLPRLRGERAGRHRGRRAPGCWAR